MQSSLILQGFHGGNVIRQGYGWLYIVIRSSGSVSASHQQPTYTASPQTSTYSCSGG
jgi:hypothetical protein